MASKGRRIFAGGALAVVMATVAALALLKTAACRGGGGGGAEPTVVSPTAPPQQATSGEEAPPAPPEPPQRPVWPDRRPIAVVRPYIGAYWNTQRYSGNPLGLQGAWADPDGGMAWLMSNLEQLRRSGYERLMVTLPAGRPRGARIPWPSAQWHLLSERRRREFREQLTPWLAAHPSVQVIFYIGFRVKDSQSLDMTGAHVPDLDNPSDRELMERNIEPWLALTPDAAHPQVGLGFDHSSPDDSYQALIRVARTYLDRHIWVTGEAIPTEVGPDGNTIARDDAVHGAPWFGLLRFLEHNDPNSEWRFDPSTTEVGVGLHQLTTDPAGLIRDFRERGFTFVVYGRDWDPYVLEASQPGG